MPLTGAQTAAYEVAKSVVIAGRDLLFERPDADLPSSGSDVIAGDDRIPQIGFVGAAYESRKILLVGINPGNGPRDARSPSDSKMMPMLHSFTSHPDVDTYAAAIRAQMEAFPDWLACREIGPLLEEEGVRRIEIAYANANPYRAGRGESRDVFPNKARERLAAKVWLSPLIFALKPRLIIAHGQKAADVLGNCGLQAAPLIYNRNRNQQRRSAANVEFVRKLRIALNGADTN